MPLTQANIVSDAMGGASEVEQYNRDGIANYIKLDRVFQIAGMNQYISPRQAMNDAKALIKTVYPVLIYRIYHIYRNTWCQPMQRPGGGGRG